MNTDSTPRKYNFWNSLEEENFVALCFAASFFGAYIVGFAASYGLAAWEFSDARAIKPSVLYVLASPILKWNGSPTEFAANVILWLIPLVICLAISAVWVKPIADYTSLSRRARLVGATAAGALASLGLFICLARWEEFKHPKHYAGAGCQRNLQQLSLASRMYADEHPRGEIPAMSSTPGTLALKDGLLNPEYLTDITVLRCPTWNANKQWYQPPARTIVTMEDDQSYFYLGYRIPDQATLEQFAAAYQAQLKLGKSFDSDLPLVAGAGAIPRLTRRETPEQASRIPIMFDRHPNRHDPAGGNVLYLDGHIERIEWGTKWPMTPEAMEVLLALDELGKD